MLNHGGRNPVLPTSFEGKGVRVVADDKPDFGCSIRSIRDWRLEPLPDTRTPMEIFLNMTKSRL
jgi:hypothetical protein